MSAGSSRRGSGVEELLRGNRQWAAQMEREQPGFFRSLVRQHRPRYLWIGCADSRVPANEIVGLPPGEVFVHRNVANLVVHSDLNCLSVMEFGLSVLGIEDLIVCGHYGCGGVNAALQPSEGRLVDHWIRHIRDIAKFYRERLEVVEDGEARARMLCELNVAVQVVHVEESPVVQSLRKAGRRVRVHGWIYDVGDGLLRDLTSTVAEVRAFEPA